MTDCTVDEIVRLCAALLAWQRCALSQRTSHSTAPSARARCQPGNVLEGPSRRSVQKKARIYFLRQPPASNSQLHTRTSTTDKHTVVSKHTRICIAAPMTTIRTETTQHRRCAAAVQSLCTG
jgi:hypothetical protein